MNATSEIPTSAALDIDAAFTLHYARVARTIALVTSDLGRAEELAVEVFLRWSRLDTPVSEGWLYRTASNLAIDELRRQRRQARLDRLLHWFHSQPTPEEILSVDQERARVRDVLGRLAPRNSQLLILRTEGLSYEDLAAALDLNPASVGTLLGRAQRAFRKEYIARYGRYETSR